MKSESLRHVLEEALAVLAPTSGVRAARAVGVLAILLCASAMVASQSAAARSSQDSPGQRATALIKEMSQARESMGQSIPPVGSPSSAFLAVAPKIQRFARQI